MAIAVSTAWKNAIQAQFRYPAYIKMTLGVIQPGLREGTSISTSATESITSTDTIKDNNPQQSEPAATFELNRWIGDGSMYLPSANAAQNPHLEWWSNAVLNGSNSVTLTFTFDRAYTIPGLYCVWDTETNSWPTDLTVRGYNISGQLIHTYNVTSISSNEGYFDAAFENVKQVQLVINSWSKPSWRARIEEIIFGLYLNFNNTKITSAVYDAESSPISAELPVAKLQMTLNNYDQEFDPMLVEGYSKYLSERQLVKVSWGFSTNAHTVEWMDAWPMYLQKWSIPNNTPIVNLTATSRLEFLTKVYRQGAYTGNTRSLKSLMEDILNNSDITREQSTDTPWELDSSLASLYTRAPAPMLASNSLIQLLAGAGGCFVDINPRNGYVRVRKSIASADYDISKAQQLGNPSVTIGQRLKSVGAYLYSYAQRSTAEQVCTFDYVINGTQTVEVEYNNGTIVSGASATITGGTLVSATYHARGATLQIRTTSATTVSVTISGYIVDESKALVSFYSNAAVDRGVEVLIDNPFITEQTTLQVAATAVRDYYLKRKTVDTDYLGYPELEVGDLIDMSSHYGNFSGGIEKLQLTFNGGFTGKATILAEEADE